jgi:hypothetical protein
LAGEFYDLAVPQFLQVLQAQSAMFGKAEAYCTERGLNETDWLAARLYPDMQPLAFQVRQVLNHSAGAIARLRGTAYPREIDPVSFAACRSMVRGGLDSMLAIDPKELDGAATREVVFETPQGPLTFSGGAFLMSFAFPNLYFHASIAYALLRGRGLPIGKRDFLGGG